MTPPTDLEQQLSDALQERAASLAAPTVEAADARVHQRLGVRRRQRRTRVVALAVTLSVCVGVMVAIGVGREVGQERERVTVGPPPLPAFPAVPRVAVFGGSEALQAGWGLSEGYGESGEAVVVDGFTGLGCTVLRTPQRYSPGVGVESSDPTCNDWARIWAEKVDAVRPDVVVLYPGAWEIVDRKVPGDDTWRGPGDPVFDAYLAAEMQTAIDVLGSRGATVVWVAGPHPGLNAGNQLPTFRTDRVNETARQVVARNPDAAVVEFGAWFDALADSEQLRLRPDGVHLSNARGNDTTTEVCERFLCAAIIDAALSTAPARDSEAWPSTGRELDADRCVVADGCRPRSAVGLEFGRLPAGYDLRAADADSLMAGARQRRWVFASSSGDRVDVRLFTAVSDGSSFSAAGAGPQDGVPIGIGRRAARFTAAPFPEGAPITEQRTVGAVLAPGVQLVVSSTALSREELIEMFGEITVVNRIDPLPGPATDQLTRMLVTMASIDQDVTEAAAALAAAGWEVAQFAAEADVIFGPASPQVALFHAPDGRVQAVRFAPS